MTFHTHHVRHLNVQQFSCPLYAIALVNLFLFHKVQQFSRHQIKTQSSVITCQMSFHYTFFLIVTTLISDGKVRQTPDAQWNYTNTCLLGQLQENFRAAFTTSAANHAETRALPLFCYCHYGAAVAFPWYSSVSITEQKL